MQFMKKILCALILCTLITPAYVSAENNDKYTVSLFDSDSQAVQPTDEEAEFLHYLVSQFLEYKEEIEVPEKYSIKSDRFGELYSHCMGHLMQNEYPELFYPDISVGTYMNEDKTISALTAEYPMSAEEIYRSRAFIYQELEKIKGLLDDDMTDVEKVLTVHDYIAASYEYDTSVFDDPANAVRTLDQMVIQKRGVCEGYSDLFKFVMDNIGIECEAIPSDECEHMWNKVKISVNGGEKKWYNVDVTFDDPLMDMASGVSHKFFLISDDEISTDENHSVWNEYKWDNCTSVEKAVSEDFSQSVIHGINGQLVYKDGEWYGFVLTEEDDKPVNNLCTVDLKNNAVTPVYSHNSIWYLHGQHRSYLSQVSSMALFDGDIFFNTPDKLYRFDTDTRTAEEIYDFETKNPDKKDVSKTYMYGLRIRDNTLYAEYTTKPYAVEGVIDEPQMDDLIPIKETTPEFPFWSQIRSVSDNEFTVYTTAQGGTPLAAQYDESGTFLGFARETGSPFKCQYVCDDSCKTVRAFVWTDKNCPLTDTAELVR